MGGRGVGQGCPPAYVAHDSKNGALKSQRNFRHADVWDMSRKYEAGLKGVESGLCDLCGREEQTADHLIWGCSVVKGNEHPDIKRSNYLCRGVHKRAANGTPCYYLRGLTPKWWTARDPVRDMTLKWCGERDPYREFKSLGECYLDGSGGSTVLILGLEAVDVLGCNKSRTQMGNGIVLGYMGPSLGNRLFPGLNCLPCSFCCSFCLA